MSRYIDIDKFIEDNAEIIDCEIDHREYQDTIRELIEEAPLAEVKPIVYGEWLIYKAYQGGIEEKWFQCSKCGWENALLIPRNFCPSCGSRMKEK